jgi:hypothetical protein
MDVFVSRKKRNLSSPPKSKTTEETSALSAPDDESTDFKLALLSSLHPYVEQQVLLDVLLAHEGSVEKASGSLRPPDSPPRKTSAATGYQSSLSGFVTANDAVDVPGKKLLSKKGKTLHLYSPEDVAKHTPCSIIHNFLPAEEANALLGELLKEAPTFERMTFKLFDNVVQSPHTACFYVEGMEELRRQKTEYIYNGGLLTVSPPKSVSSQKLISIGCSPTNAPDAESVTQSPGSGQFGNRDPYQNPVSRWQETQVPVARPVEAKCSVRELLQWWCRERRIS